MAGRRRFLGSSRERANANQTTSRERPSRARSVSTITVEGRSVVLPSARLDLSACCARGRSSVAVAKRVGRCTHHRCRCGYRRHCSDRAREGRGSKRDPERASAPWRTTLHLLIAVGERRCGAAIGRARDSPAGAVSGEARLAVGIPSRTDGPRYQIPTVGQERSREATVNRKVLHRVRLHARRLASRSPQRSLNLEGDSRPVRRRELMPSYTETWRSNAAILRSRSCQTLVQDEMRQTSSRVSPPAVLFADGIGYEELSCSRSSRGPLAPQLHPLVLRGPGLVAHPALARGRSTNDPIAPAAR